MGAIDPARSPVGVCAHAPVRIADVGGWTDTWFAHSGSVCHVAVEPGVTVEVRGVTDGSLEAGVHLVAPDLGEDYRFGPDDPDGWATWAPTRQPLLESAIASVLEHHDRSDPIRVAITSAVAAGASLGTSASVLVALLAALEAYRDGRADTAFDETDRHRLARAAHLVETERVGRQAGVQDHWAAAFGGAQLLSINPYPTVEVDPITLSASMRRALDTQVVTVLFGPHDSSAVHERVIAALTRPGRRPAHGGRILEELAALAGQARTALGEDDLGHWAETLSDATDAQRRLHPDLVGPAHRTAIDLARSAAAIGWKVNGAGGGGGSLSVVFASPSDADEYRQRITTTQPSWVAGAFSVADGVHVRSIADH